MIINRSTLQLCQVYSPPLLGLLTTGLGCPVCGFPRAENKGETVCPYLDGLPPECVRSGLNPIEQTQHYMMQSLSPERIPCLVFLGLSLSCAILAQNMVPQEKCTHCCRGPSGMPGIPGSPGQNGRRGNDGEKGLKGEMGFAGIDGTKGETGPVGPLGETGGRGKRGRKGECGPKGATGEPGQKGERGYTGFKGKKGERGEMPKTTAKVAFSAARSKKLGPVFQETTVTFDKIFTNVGESFDEYSSHFVCKVNGTYFFTTSVVGQLKIDAFAWIMMNNKHMVPLHGDGRAGHGTGSNSLILHLTAEDHLWVQLIKDSALLNDYSTFSGYLLFED